MYSGAPRTAAGEGEERQGCGAWPPPNTQPQNRRRHRSGHRHRPGGCRVAIARHARIFRRADSRGDRIAAAFFNGPIRESGRRLCRDSRKNRAEKAPLFKNPVKNPLKTGMAR